MRKECIVCGSKLITKKEIESSHCDRKECITELEQFKGSKNVND